MITLADNEERLVQVFRSLPRNVADQIITWMTGLHDLSNGKPIDWSDTWTREDLADVQRASLATFEQQEHR